jgi:hypothetical protein
MKEKKRTKNKYEKTKKSKLKDKIEKTKQKLTKESMIKITNKKKKLIFKYFQLKGLP